MFPLKAASLVAMALIAFAANSLLCRLALHHAAMPPVEFTLIRLVSAALTLLLVVGALRQPIKGQGSWLGALALFGYAITFSLAYVELETGVGALLLFASVQLTMFGYGFIKGERLTKLQWLGFSLACVGLLALFLPGLRAPSMLGSLLMVGAGVSWALYTLFGLSKQQALASTTMNFVRTLPMVGLAFLWWGHPPQLLNSGVGYAIVSGAVASGLGYAIWYAVLPALRVTSAATAQLSVPILASFAGAIWLGEQITLNLLVASVAVLVGSAMVIWFKKESVRVD